MIKYCIQDRPNLSQKIIIVSGISIGSVPTLALDYLIVANGFKRIGFIASEHLEPSVGYLHKNIEGGALGLGCELYEFGNVVIIQLRSGIRFGRRKQFISQIADLVAVQGKTPEILVLSSLPYDLRPDLEIQSLSENIYHYSKSEESSLKRALSTLKGVRSIRELLDEDEEDKQLINESGLLRQFSKQSKLSKVSSLLIFSQQLPDRNVAVVLAKSVRALMGVEMDIKQLSQSINLQILQ